MYNDVVLLAVMKSLLTHFMSFLSVILLLVGMFIGPTMLILFLA